MYSCKYSPDLAFLLAHDVIAAVPANQAERDAFLGQWLPN